MGLLKLLAVMAIAVGAPVAGAVNFQPPIAWSATGGDTVQANIVPRWQVQHVTEDGRLLWFGTVDADTGIVVRALLQRGQPTSFDQFGLGGGQEQGNRVVVERVLADRAGIALVRLSEDRTFSGSGLPVLAAVDFQSGGILWTARFAADRAVALDAGEWLVLAAGQVLRLRADGGLRWARHVAEFAPSTEEVATATVHAGGGRALVVVSRVRRTLEAPPLPLEVLAVDLVDGALAWRATAAGLYACGAGLVGDALLLASSSGAPADATTALAIQRLALGNGAVVAATTLSAVPAGGLACQVVDVDGTAVVSTANGGGAGVLAAVDGAGALRWRRDLEPGLRPLLARVPGSTDVVHSAVVPGTQEDRRVQRRRGLDGSVAWSTVQSLSSNDRNSLMAVSDTAVDLYWTPPFDILITRLSIADGSPQGLSGAGPRARFRLPYEAAFVDGEPFDAKIAPGNAVVVRRLDPTAPASALWTATDSEAPAAWEPRRIQLRGAGAGRLLVVSEYFDPSGIGGSRRAVVLAMLDRASGATLWRREASASLGFTPVSALDAGTDGVLLSLVPCAADGSCAPSASDVLRRLSAQDGATVWEQPLSSPRAAFANGEVIAFVFGGGADFNRWRGLAGATGETRWTQTVFQAVAGGEILPAPSPGVIAVDALATSTPEVTVRRLGVADGSGWIVRAGSFGEGVVEPLLRRAVNGMSLLAAQLQVPAPAPTGSTRPLLELINPATSGTLFSVRPVLTGDRKWILQPIDASDPAATQQPLQSTRNGDGSFRPQFVRVGLAHLDLAGGVLGGEHLVESRFDPPLLTNAQTTLVRTTLDGDILPTDLRSGPDGLPKRRLLRLSAPADGQGDLQVRVRNPEFPFEGFGPSRRIEIEIENAGTTRASEALFGVLPMPYNTNSALRLLDCTVTTGTGTCPVDASQRRVTLDPGATVRLAWEILPGTFSNAPPPTIPGLSALRAYVDAPWGYADTEPGNNVVDFTMRLGAFGDDFE